MFDGKLLRRLSLPALLSMSLAAPALADEALADEAMDWLQRMSDAMRNLNYQGDFVYLHQNQLESMRIWHYRDAQGEKERLVSLNGEAREVLRDDRNLTCIWPSSRKVVVDQSRHNSFSPIFIPEDIARLDKFYRMSLHDRDRIAGARTMVVHIDPEDEFRYGFRFWVNRENGLMMKSSLIGENDQEIEQVMFTNLRLFAPEERLVVDTMPPIDEDYTRVLYHRGGDVEVSSNDWQLDDPPGGFWRESSVSRRQADSEDVLWQMVYTDGLASLSIFVERMQDDTMSGPTSMGAVNAFIRHVDGHTVTAIGEVPAITVERFANNLRRR